MRWIWKLLFSTLAVFVAAHFVPGIVVKGVVAGVITAIVLGVINTIIRPIILFFTLPITILTLGLFTLVINALLFWITGHIVPGFEVHGFLAAFLGSIVVSLVSWILNLFIKD